MDAIALMNLVLFIGLFLINVEIVGARKEIKNLQKQLDLLSAISK